MRDFYTPVSYRLAFGVGVLSAFILSLLMAAGVYMQWTPTSLEMLLGSFVTGKIGATTWMIGFGWHLLNGGLFGLVYGYLFRTTGYVGSRFGMATGLVHWVVAGVLLNAFLLLHPLASVALATSPSQLSIFAWPAFGGMTFVGSLVLHVLFGAIVGAMCAASVRKKHLERETLGRESTRRAA